MSTPMGRLLSNEMSSIYAQRLRDAIVISRESVRGRILEAAASVAHGKERILLLNEAAGLLKTYTSPVDIKKCRDTVQILIHPKPKVWP